MNSITKDEFIVEQVLGFDAICADFEDYEETEWIEGYGSRYSRWFDLLDLTVKKNGEWVNVAQNSETWNEVEDWLAANWVDFL